MKKSMVYFVLYVVLITELLIVITERDELEEKEHAVRDKMLQSIAESYKAPLLLAIPNKSTDYNIGNKENPYAAVIFTPVGLVSDEEKKSVEFFVTLAPGSKTPAGWPSGGVTTKQGNDKFWLEQNGDGNARFMGEYTAEGDYSFRVFCQVERQFPGYLPDYLLEELKHMVGEQHIAKSPTEDFKVSAKRQGGVVRKGAEIVF